MDESKLISCELCPRACKVDRLHGQKGYCKVTSTLKVARAALHFWEEPCISGTRGSGAVFFSGCNMGCVFCQNRVISRGKEGKTISVMRLAEIFLELEAQGAHNINLVTPTHYTLQIIDALKIAKARGLKLPIVYNCSGYESVATLKLLEGYIDIYLPDFKYKNETYAKKYSHAPHYYEVAQEAIAEMVRQIGPAIFDADGLMTRGVIVRHLLLPGRRMDAKHIVKMLYETYGNEIYISMMNQYTPCDELKDYPELQKPVTERSYEILVDYAIGLGIENGFVQEGGTVSESFIPSFNGEGVELK